MPNFAREKQTICVIRQKKGRFLTSLSVSENEACLDDKQGVPRWS